MSIAVNAIIRAVSDDVQAKGKAVTEATGRLADILEAQGDRYRLTDRDRRGLDDAVEDVREANQAHLLALRCYFAVAEAQRAGVGAPQLLAIASNWPDDPRSMADAVKTDIVVGADNDTKGVDWKNIKRDQAKWNREREKEEV